MIPNDLQFRTDRPHEFVLVSAANLAFVPPFEVGPLCPLTQLAWRTTSQNRWEQRLTKNARMFDAGRNKNQDEATTLHFAAGPLNGGPGARV